MLSPTQKEEIIMKKVYVAMMVWEDGTEEIFEIYDSLEKAQSITALAERQNWYDGAKYEIKEYGVY
jgi:uncharacterized membrane protein